MGTNEKSLIMFRCNKLTIEVSIKSRIEDQNLIVFSVYSDTKYNLSSRDN